jgi:Tol biopolymer transport system component
MKLVDGGELPGFSPDGATIAYLVPAALTNRAALFVISARGGAPRHLQPDLVAIYPSPLGGHQAPLWSPDGTNILFRGMRVGDPKTRGWWIASVSGGEAAAIEGVPAEPEWLARYALAWRGEYIYYLEGEPINGSTLYRARLASRPWRITGTPEKLTSYAGVSTAASTSARGRMVFASLAPVTNIWSASLQAGKGATSGQLERITADSNGKRRLTVAANGSRLAYSSYGPPGQANVEVRVREIATGRESLIAGSGKWPLVDPTLSPDGSKVAYMDMQEGKLVTYIAESSATSGRVVCEGCVVRAFFRNPSEALVQMGDRLMRHRLDGGGQVPLIQIPSLIQVALSPDGNRLAFTQARQDGAAALYLADIPQSPGTPESWKLVAEDRNYLGSPAWSPDGRLLYYVSQRDGSPCVWAQPIAPDRKLAGAATPVLHLHSGNGVVGRTTGIGVTTDRLFVLLTEFKGDVWSINLER